LLVVKSPKFIPEEQIVSLVKKHFNLKPKAIIDTLDLRRPIYKKTAAYGHFGRNEPEFTWEKTDKAEILSQEAGLSVSQETRVETPAQSETLHMKMEEHHEF